MNLKKLSQLVPVGLVVLIASFVLVSRFTNHEETTQISQTEPQVGGAQTKEASVFKDITPKEAYFLIRNNQDNPNFTIVDVRTSGEYSSGHIENAINLDSSSSIFKDELNKLDKNKIYLIYCGTGRRSQVAQDAMKVLGFREVYNMASGIARWERDGLPIIRIK